MTEQFRHQLSLMAAETMYMLWEAEHQRDARDLDVMMRRLKDLSAFSLINAEILDLQEGVELLAIAMFFGASSDERFQPNQERLRHISQETVVYQGDAQKVARKIRRRLSSSAPDDTNTSTQPRLL
jgi:hypothetical protein